MSLAYVIDDVFLGHRAPSAHPERPERLRAVRDALLAAGLAERARALPVRAAKEHEIGMVHSAQYIEELSRIVPGRSGFLDPDTYFSPGTWDAALAAVGAVVDLTRAALSGEHTRGLALVRPPGHHAVADQAMGFCLLNNIAVAAADARARGAARVAVLDWDVHHGNGTESMFYDDPTVLFLSCHQFPQYPGTGRPEDTGVGPGVGANINVALPAGCGDREYQYVFERVFVPALRRHRPDIILVSAGFDAHIDDPLADMRVTREGFLYMARTVAAVADEVCEGRMVCTLEGGYDLNGLAGGVTALFEAMTATAAAPEHSNGMGADMGASASTPEPTSAAPIMAAAKRAVQRTLACLGPSDTSDTSDTGDTDDTASSLGQETDDERRSGATPDAEHS